MSAADMWKCAADKFITLSGVMADKAGSMCWSVTEIEVKVTS